MAVGGLHRTCRGAAAGLIALTLAACVDATVQPSLKPQARPAAVAPAPAVAKPTSQKSASLRRYLNDVQRAQLSQGLLRQDGGGVDTPFTPDMLARNFEQIAFFNEYDGNFSGRGGASPLRRWESPVRLSVVYGAGVPASRRAADTMAVMRYVRRLARATGHPITTSGRPNFVVVIASEDDRGTALQKAANALPGVNAESLAPFRDLRRDTYCAVAAFASGGSANTYTAAVAVIRAENPDLLRLSCIHEELAQGLGLANDSPAARPSIFNDDDEFALLTRHDELLLQMLYDARLRTGMSASEAAPVTRIIARELISGPL
ncbi:MAG: DUF2927 domain-containing protein [Pseudomonadota bacterium]